ANNRAQFFQLFYNLDHELDASPIQDALDAHGDDEYEEAAKLSLNTKTSPRPETAKKLHTRLFEENMLPLLSELESSTGQPISLDRDRAIVALQWNLRDKEIESFFYGAEIAHKAGIAIPESMMDEAATESLQVQLGTPHWAEAVDKVKKEYAKAGHDPSATLKEYEGIGNFANHVTAVWLARDKHTYGGIRPLHEMAIQKNYDAFRKEACRLVQDMIDTAPSLPETWPDKEQKLENLYSILLDLALAQTLKGQKTVVKAQQLAEATNHPISIDCMVQGLARHVKSHANQTDPDLLAKLAERGITIDGKAIYERVAEIVLKEGEEFGKRLAYLQSITKGTTITEKMQELGRQHAVRCLINSHIDDYDRLLAAGIKLELITGDQERLKAAALDLLGNEDLDPFDSFKERIPFTLEIDADEADEVLESYFETYPGTTPSVVASRMNVPVPEDKVQREYHFLVPSADNEYNWEQVFFHLDRMKELYDDTEFAPTESVCWEFLEAVGSSLRPRVFARLQEDVVYNPTPEQAEMIFERLECNMDISMSQEFKLATKMIELGHHPDVEIKRDLIVNTLATTRKFRDLRWDVIQAYTTRGYVVADDVIEDWVATGFKHVGNRNYDLINVLHHLDSDLQRSDYGSDDQARTACTLIDHEFDIHPAEQNSEGTNTEPIGWVYERAGMKQSATDRATKLFNDDHLYAGFAYCVIAEVKPDLATAEVGELSRRYEHGLSNRMFLKRFNGDEKDQFRAMLEAWK
ncbi:hypothetical protein CMO91_06225, partial [Candidatus Woesearchaeota archaeon]|nr:hypothetical protein [Candidatus Woesearchaeota archaeon]